MAAARARYLPSRITLFAIYDMQQNVEFKGTVETIKLRNPHMAMTPDDERRQRPGSRPSTSSRAHRRTCSRDSACDPSKRRPASEITAIGAPRHDNPNAWFLKAIILQDGTRFNALHRTKRASAISPADQASPSIVANRSNEPLDILRADDERRRIDKPRRRTAADSVRCTKRARSASSCGEREPHDTDRTLRARRVRRRAHDTLRARAAIAPRSPLPAPGAARLEQVERGVRRGARERAARIRRPMLQRVRKIVAQEGVVHHARQRRSPRAVASRPSEPSTTQSDRAIRN